jgi:5-methylcytosine-specific restriction endonuclease McrA
MGDRAYIPSALRRRVMARSGNACAACGVSFDDPRVCVDLDHRVPRAVWPRGELEEANLQALCGECHLWKTRKSGERRRIERFRALARTPSERLCWDCDRVVSRYFYADCVCARCLEAASVATSSAS